MSHSALNDSSAAQRRRRIAVIGGGISGLAAAHRAGELDPSAHVVLLDASSRVGGVLETVRRDGWLIERSADMFTTREPWALDLCRRIGIADDLVETDARFRRAFVVRRGRLVPVPEGFTLMSPAKIWPIVTTPILSTLGKLRLACERFVPAKRDEADESLRSFVVRRFGREAFERLIQPLIGGIYTADPAKLSMAATLPQFVEMERRWGSLIRGMQHKRPVASSQDGAGARYGQFVAPREGMQRLVEALAARLPAGCVRLKSPVERIEHCRERPPWRSDDRAKDVNTSPRTGTEAVPYSAEWRIFFRQEPMETFDDVIIATPGAVSSRLLNSIDAKLSELIGRIAYAGCSIAVLGVRRDKIKHALDGFGFVVPAIENRQIIAGSMASVKFPGRAPEGKVLLRIFIGGALQPGLAELDEEEIRRIVRGELAELIGLSGEPEFFEVARWPGMMPQYHVGHLQVVGQIEELSAAIPHFALAGNAYRGVGIPFCVRSGEQAAEKLMRNADSQCRDQRSRFTASAGA